MTMIDRNSKYQRVLIDPREYDNLGKLICFHKRYRLGDPHDIDYTQFKSWFDMEQWLYAQMDAVVVVPVFLYDHSGLVMTAQVPPTPCNHWDCGQVGFIYVDKETALREYGPSAFESIEDNKLTEDKIDLIINILIDEVNEYNLYLNGEGEDADFIPNH